MEVFRRKHRIPGWLVVVAVVVGMVVLGIFVFVLDVTVDALRTIIFH